MDGLTEEGVVAQYQHLVDAQQVALTAYERAVEAKCIFLADLHKNGWSYRRLATALGVSAPWIQELVDRVVRPEVVTERRRRRSRSRTWRDMEVEGDEKG